MLQESDLLYRFRIPNSLGYFPDLQLLLMEALPGKPFFKELLKTWTGNSPGSGKDVPLEQAVRTCALIAATLHSSKIKLGRQTTLEIQVGKLGEEADVLHQVFPEVGAQVQSGSTRRWNLLKRTRPCHYALVTAILLTLN